MAGKILKKIGESSLFLKKTPQFWHQDGFIPQLLVPLTLIYFILKRLTAKSSKNAKKLPAKIICIGNAVVGGAGKTPTAISVANELKKIKPASKIAFVTTGFKAKLTGPVIVDPANHKFYDVGDEALILATYAPCIICKDRLKGMEFAIEQGFEYIILDDGLHDKRMVKDISFLVIDGKYGFGNGMLLPSGPLRDRLDFATEGVDHIIMVGNDAQNSLNKLQMFTKKDYNIIPAFIDVTTNHDENQIYVAFAGIGRPEKFFSMLKEDMKFTIAETVEFADHHFYTGSDIEHLKEIASQQKAKLITTEKDYVKLPPEFRDEVECVKIELGFEDKKINEILSSL